MRFEVRDLAVNLLPQNPGEGKPPGCQGNTGCPGCTPSAPGAPGCTTCSPSPENPTDSCFAAEPSLGTLRRQLRDTLAQPGAH